MHLGLKLSPGPPQHMVLYVYVMDFADCDYDGVKWTRNIYILCLMVLAGPVDHGVPYIQALGSIDYDMQWAPDPKYIYYG